VTLSQRLFFLHPEQTMPKSEIFTWVCSSIPSNNDSSLCSN